MSSAPVLEPMHRGFDRKFRLLRPVYRCLGLSQLWLVISIAAVLGCVRNHKPDSDHSTNAERNSAMSPKSTRRDSGASPASSESSGKIEFIEVTQQAGVQSVYQNGREAGEHAILEGLGGGVAMFDYDRDGLPDLLFATGGTIGKDRTLAGLPATLWRNRGSVRFDRVESLARIDQAPYFSHGVSSADYDNDGFSDVLVTGYGGLQLFRNEGDGTFTEVSRISGLVDSSWSTSAAWLDRDGDGNLDLYVTHYVNWSWDNHPKCGTVEARDACSPYDFEGLTDIFYGSNGNGTFSNLTSEVALVPGGKGLGVVTADLNFDGRTDIYVANDTTNNFLYLNQADGKLDEVGLISGTAVDERGIPNGSMGLAVFDFDRDAKPEIWVTNFENETCAMYKNEGLGNFRCITNSTGINALGTLYVGFGTVAADFDLDGFEDLAVANGHLQNYAPLAQDQLLLRNELGQRLRRVEFSSSSYFSQKHIGRGLVAGDLDLDGRLDLVFANSTEPAAILLNQSEVGSALWLNVTLVGTTANRDAIGATAILSTDSGQFVRSVCGGGSYLSQSPYSLTWAIPQEIRSATLTVVWPGNHRESFELRAFGRITIEQSPR